MKHLRLITLLVATTVLSNGEPHKVHAPFNKEYPLADQGKILSWMNPDKAMGAVTYHRGLLLIPMSFDFGGGEGHGAFAAYNIDDPTKPVPVFDSRDYPKIYHDKSKRNYLGNAGEIHGMYFHNDLLLLQEKGHNHAGFAILDLAPLYDDDPATLPQIVCRYAFPGVERSTIYDGFSFAPAWIGGRYVIAPTGTFGLYIIDTQDLAHPKLIAHLPKAQLYNETLRSAHAIGDLLILSPSAVATDKDSIVLIDISNPANPTLINRHPVKIGYQGAVYGSRFYNGAFAAGRGEDKVAEIIAYDFSDPYNIREIHLGKPEDTLFRIEYSFLQDDQLFIGHYPGLTKWNIDQDKATLIPQASIEPQFPPNNDYAFISPLGSLAIITSDHDVQSKINIGIHSSTPDSKGPELRYILPKKNQKNVSTLTKIGISFSDFIDNECLEKGALVLHERGSDQIIPCDLSHGLGIVHLVPKSPLKIDTSYDLFATENLLDMMGNRFEGDRHLTSFSTGAELTDYNCQIVVAPAAQIGTSVTFKSETNNPALVDSLLYSWDFGNGDTPTPFTAETTIAKTFSKPGNYNITLTTKRQDSDKRVTSSAVQVIHDHLPKTRPVSSSTLHLDSKTNTLYVVNPDNNTLTALDTKTGQPRYEKPTGTNPVCLIATGDQLWISCHHAEQISIHSQATGEQLKTIPLPYGSAPYGLTLDSQNHRAHLALSATGIVQEIDLKTQTLTRQLQVTGPLRHLAYLPEKQSLVAPQFVASHQQGAQIHWIDTTTYTLSKTETLAPTLDQDGQANGRGYPNYLGSIAINPEQTRVRIAAKKDNLFRGLQRDGQPLIFDHTVRSITPGFDVATQTEIPDERIDLDNNDFATAAAYNSLGNIFYVATLGSSTINAVDAYSPNRITTYNTYGKGATAIVISPETSLLYLHNQLSRSIAVFHARPDGRLDYHTKWPTVAKEFLSPSVLRGKKIFHDTSRSHLSREGYMSCASCHHDGSHDGRIWDLSNLGEGLRNTIDLRGRGGMKHGQLHWTGNFNEVQDFDDQIRQLNQGTGFLAETMKKQFRPLFPHKAGLSYELDELAKYLTSLSDYPKSPHKNPDGTLTPDAVKGRQHFISLKCYTCHSGPTFTDSARAQLHDLGTASKTSGTRLGKTLTGFDTPTLISLWQSAPYLHDGSAATLEDVFKKGTAEHSAHQVPEEQKAQLIAFLLQLDSEKHAITGKDLGSSNKPPVFAKDSYRIDHFYRYDHQQHPLGKITATDPDAGQKVTYHIAPSTYSPLFAIDAQSGVLTFLFKDVFFRDIANKIFRETRTYPVTIIARDNGDFPQESRTTVQTHITFPELPFENKELNKFIIYNLRLLDGKNRPLKKAQADHLRALQERLPTK